MSAAINDGGPAFPFLELDGAGMPYQQNPGMTLRDHFAEKAMAARLMAAWSEPGPSIEAFHTECTNQPPDAAPLGFEDWIAKSAFRMADAMLAARGKA